MVVFVKGDKRVSSYQAGADVVTGPAAEFAKKTVEVDGVRLRYRVSGSGAAVVCLHGGGGLRLSRADEMLAETHRVIAFELPGFGESLPDPQLATLADYASLMNRAIAALAIDRYNLVGHGLGAGLALTMALARPDPVDAIVLIAPVAIRLKQPVPQDMAALGRDLLYAHPERQPEAGTLASGIASMQRKTVARFLGELRNDTLETALGELQIPVLALFGTEDQITPTEMARLYRTSMPNCHVVMVYDAAHAIDAERPEAVASIAADFIARREKFIVRQETDLIHP
jgi:pimeloyl-ACP methyl ester carboxylesterase